MKSLLILFSFVLFSKFTYAACVVPELPDSLDFRIQLLFSVAKVGKNNGKIKSVRESSENHNWLEYRWLNKDGTRIATAKVSDFSWETEISVYDCENKKIGTIKENIIKDSLEVEYYILNAEGSEIAKSTAVDFLNDGYHEPMTISNSNDESEVAKLEDSESGWWGGLSLDTYSPVVDSRLLVMLGAFRTDLIKFPTIRSRYYSFK